MKYLIALWLIFIAHFGHAEEIVLGMNRDQVAITADFDGSEILIFGAVKRETPIADGRLDVIVAVTGPNQRMNVRRKERRFGIWMNTQQIEVDAAPSFYAVATSNSWDQVITDTEDLRHRISIDRAIRAVDIRATNRDEFNAALTRIKQSQGKYAIYENGVRIDQQTLFQTRIPMPANLTTGDYATRIFLTRDGQVISKFETIIDVHKVGLEEFLYTLAHEQPFLYALMSLIIASFAGWGASAFFRMVRSR